VGVATPSSPNKRLTFTRSASRNARSSAKRPLSAFTAGARRMRQSMRPPELASGTGATVSASATTTTRSARRKAASFTSAAIMSWTLAPASIISESRPLSRSARPRLATSTSTAPRAR